MIHMIPRAARSLACAGAWGVRTLWLMASMGVAGVAQDDAADKGLSRQMRLGIEFYEKGEDAQAMDRFMDVLTRGAQAERALANEYINLITQRMNAGAAVTPPRAPTAARPPAESPAPRDPQAGASAKSPAAARSPRASESPAVVVETQGEPSSPPAKTAPPVADSPSPRPNREVMEREIRTKIRAVLDRNLKVLRDADDVEVLTLENGDPLALAFPTPVFFKSDIVFNKKTAPGLLDALAGVAYALKRAQIYILPEGTAIGDAKVLDMRRTMGISSHLYASGISPARVKVNLLSTQVEIPKALREFKGIIVLFVYNKPLDFGVEGSIADSAGPPLSLGVFPERFRPDRGEGVIIEFSVMEPPSGLASWRFQLLRPAAGGGDGDLAPLNQVLGSGPVSNQVYWNGRKGYFGAALPTGRYECVLTATDGKNHQRTLHRWIHLIGPDAAQSPALLARSAGAPSANLPGLDDSGVSGLVRPASAAPRPRRGARRRPAAGAETAAPAASGPAPGGMGEIVFAKDSAELPASAEAVLKNAARDLAASPEKELSVRGFAHSGEAEAEGLAQKRAQAAAEVLIGKHGADSGRVQVHSAVSEKPEAKVVVKLVGNE